MIAQSKVHLELCSTIGFQELGMRGPWSQLVTTILNLPFGAQISGFVGCNLTDFEEF